MAPSLWRTNASTACDESPYGIGLDGGKPARIACRRPHDHPVVQDHAGLHGQQQHREQDRDEERRFHSRLPALACAQNAQSPPPCESES